MPVTVSAQRPTPCAVYMRAAGIKARDLAGELGVTAPYLSQVLNGHGRPSRQLSRSIARVLDQPEDWLFPAAEPSESELKQPGGACIRA